MHTAVELMRDDLPRMLLRAKAFRFAAVKRGSGAIQEACGAGT